MNADLPSLSAHDAQSVGNYGICCDLYTPELVERDQQDAFELGQVSATNISKEKEVERFTKG